MGPRQDMKKRIVILGSTGSIGVQTLEVVREFRDEFDVVGLTAGRNSELLAEQIREFQPRFFDSLAHAESTMLDVTRVDATELVQRDEVDFVMHAMSGTAGLPLSEAAISAGKTVGLANKESIVMAGPLLNRIAAGAGSSIVPVDSEPSAIWQCLLGETDKPSKYYLTASGGAFRDREWSSLAEVSPEEALRHPNWQMGPKITVDCATLMNKAFEVIETSVLFNAEIDEIEVLLHRESVAHAMVRFPDGSVKAQMGNPDMRQPITFALSHPERRVLSSSSAFDPLSMGNLTFEPLAPGRYPCFDLAINYAQTGGTYPAVLAGADDAAVQLFLNGDIGFTDILRLMEQVLDKHPADRELSVATAIESARWAARETMALANC